MTRPGPLAAFLLLLACPAVAQETLMDVCEGSSATPAAFDACALEAYETADADLNEVYRLAIVRAKAFDEAAAVADTPERVMLEASLRRAQDDWTAFRDSDCDVLMVTLGGIDAAEDADGARTDVAASGALCRAEKALMRAQSLRELMADY